MTIYTSTFSVAGVNAASNVLVNLKAATTDRLKILEVAAFIEAIPSNAPLLLLQRMLAAGTGAITTVTGVSHDPAEPNASGSIETAWATTKPTLVGTSILGRFQAANAIGNGIIWDFTNRPIILAVSGGLCLVQSNASGVTLGTIGGWVRWDE